MGAMFGGTSRNELKSTLARHGTPPWFDDAKFGIFVHWGLYSVPGWATPVDGEVTFGAIMEGLAAGRMPYAEWYLNSLRTPGSTTERYHRETYGDASYDDFREPFEAMLETWDPDEWADRFAAAGAGYVVLTTKHHDGYLLWPSQHPNPHKPRWQTRRDVVGELSEAVRGRGMRFGVYYSGGLDWSFVAEPITDPSSVYSTVPTDATYRRYAEAHFRELIDRYRPSVLWNDISLPPRFPRDELFVDYYERVPDGVVNDRWRVVPERLAAALRRPRIRQLANRLGHKVADDGDTAATVPYFADFATPEYSVEDRIRSHRWETCRGFGHSFGYNRAEDESHMLDAADVIRDIVDVASKNGNLLLNVGPRGEDGVIPDDQASRLDAVGDWMNVNRLSVVATRPWVRAEGATSQGHEVRFTQAAGALYATVFGDVTPGPLVLDDVVVGDVVELLGHGPLAARIESGSLVVDWPDGVDPAPAHALRIGGGDGSWSAADLD